MTGGVEFRGLERLEATTERAADELRDLTETNRKAAEHIVDRASPPRDSGALEASRGVEADKDTATVGYSAEYAGVIHNGWDAHNITAQPWLEEAFTQTTDEVVDIYTDSVRQILSTIKGA